MKRDGDPTFEPMKPRRDRSPATAHLIDKRKKRLKSLHKAGRCVRP